MTPGSRADATAVRRYLEALENHRPKRGRRRTPESIDKRIGALDEKIASAPPVQRLALIQERLDLQQQRGAMSAPADLSKLEADFVAAAKAYSDSKGISYTAWRELGVPSEVLRKAGIAQTRRRTP